ncbi:uncharacterized protein LOC18437779 isoform X1 [Amborella trichopoda]|uniref:NusG-like N-terminal domain-containing protein n=1 Tax=Amborella trichopoda TaxID=13333 RepID=W1PI02_AMBTC|nr:uncharacterized protein LOC18437779 isoform X1 [Amborella trichopoda]ERN09622.1 hypothetical protein AMTR_s00029p00189100 [Amborella trichopoda]|eukprot:XP_006848041.1 uncharacterized protein LOC18437779 isoform X1 [Amborella trichopoda]
MKQGLVWKPSSLSLPPISSKWTCNSTSSPSSLSLDGNPTSLSLKTSSNGDILSAKERRQLRNQRRESKTSNWREEIEEALSKKTKKKKKPSWTEELNLDNLSLLGPQWWMVRIARVSDVDAAEPLARSLVRNFPNLEFQVYAPAVHVKKKLKNGTYSEKANPLFPGCIFLRCVLNKQIHDFIREYTGVRGFIGSKVGNTIRQINKPKPVPANEMEAIFRRAKVEQEEADRVFKDEQQRERLVNETNGEENTAEKPKRRTRKSAKPSASEDAHQLKSGEGSELLLPGSSVRVLSGPFSEFTGLLREVDHDASKAKVGFMLFGKESLVDLDINQIAHVPK